MCRVNNVVIMQTKQLGQIKTFKEKLYALEGHNQDLEHKLSEQDHVIANLVGDNLEYLQDNMWLTAHINSSLECMAQLEHCLGQVGLVLMGMIKGAIKREASLNQGTPDASGDDKDDQGGGEDNGDAGVSLEGSTRVESPMSWEGGLIAEMEREVMEAGAGGWYNGLNQEIKESWSGPNSDMSASWDWVGTTLLTTIGSQTLPNLVRVPDNLTHPVGTKIFDGRTHLTLAMFSVGQT